MKKTFNVPNESEIVSSATIHNGVAYIAGVIGMDFETGEIYRESFKDQVTKTLNNLKFIVEGVGSSMENVLSCTIFLSSMSHFDEMDEVYRSFFHNSPPARVTVAVKELWDNLDIEISAIAAVERD